MSEWKTIVASEYCNSVRDGTHDSPKPVSVGGRPLITSKHIKNGRIEYRDAYSISEGDFAKINERSLVEMWDVLMSMIGTVGECAIVKSPPEYAIKNMALFKCGGDEIKAKWLYYYLRSPAGQGQLRANHKGVSQAFVSLGMLRNLKIPFPPLPIQRRIADILSAYDDLIENNRRRIEILEETARTLYRKVVESSNCDANVELGSLASFCRGKIITQKAAIKGDVPVVAGGIAPAYFHNSANTQCPVITISGSGANAGYTRMYFERIWASDCSWADASRTDHLYFSYCFLKENADVVRNLQQGAAQPHVYPKDVNALPVPRVADEYLMRFEKDVSALFEQQAVLSRQNAKLAEARDMLLPRLMSGKMEV